jgi:serine/threonine protein kinase/WD40 repeat protein
MTATHPTDRELGDFLLGKLDDGGVESHLAECDSCRDRAVAVQADDTFTELLAAARTRFDTQRASAPTPTLDGAATPPAFAPTLAWSETPGADATGLAPDIPPALAAHPKYRPIRQLGTGGMGTVWLAEHQVMHRPVAIKVIRPDLLARPGATNRFLREVRAAAKLHHPNIVTAFDADPAGDSYLMVMEYVPGETLGERLESGPLPLVEALRAVRDAARGLAHAHAHGLIHRDIKPHNLIRSADGTTKVLDFGLAGVGVGDGVAAVGDGLTGAGMVVGTPDYIAPEQIADPHAADARADVYGLGCTLYHLLAGRSPMPDGTVTEKLAAQPTHQPDPIPGLPAALAAVLAKMLAKDPRDRYQSADEVVAALEPYCQSEDTRDGRRQPPEPGGLSKAVVRRMQWTVVVVGILATALTVGGMVYKLVRENEEIEIRTNDPDIEVVMKRNGEVLRVVDKKTGQAWTIDTAKNEIAQADTPEGLSVKLPDREPLVLRRNGKDVFTVTRTPTTPAAAKPAASPPGTPRLVRTIDHGHPVRAIAFAPDGKTVVALGEALSLYDVGTGRRVYEEKVNTDGPVQFAVSDDGRTAAVVRGSTIREFSLADGKVLGFQNVLGQGNKRLPITALAMSPDGGTVAFVAGERLMFGGAKATEPKQVKFEAPGAVVALRYSPGGGYLVAAATRPDGSRTQLIILDAQTHEVVARHDLTGMLGRIDIARDGKRLVAAGGVGNKGAFTVLSLPDGKVVQQEAALAGFVDAARLSADGKVLTLERAPGAVEVWDVERKVRVFDQPLPADPTKAGDAPVRHVAIAPDGRTVAVAHGNEIGVWELPPAPPPAVIPATPPVPRLMQTIDDGHRFPDAITYSPDGKALLTAGRAYFAMYDPATGKSLLIDSLGFAARNMPLAVSGDGRTAAVASGSNSFVYDLAAGKRRTTIPGEHVDGKIIPVTGLSLSRDGQTLAVLAGREVAYHNLATGQVEHTRPGDDNVHVQTVRYSPDGRYLVVLSHVEPDQKTRISVLDAKTRETLGRRELPGRLWRAVHLSGDGRRLFVGGTAVNKRAFAVLSLPGCAEIEQDADLPDADLPGAGLPVPSPDGTLLALVRKDGDVQIWDRGRKRIIFAWTPHPYAQPEFAPKGPKAPPMRTRVAFAPDGRTLATARGSEIRIWDLTAGPATPLPQVAPRVEFDKLQGTWNSMSLGPGHTRVTIQGTHFALRRIPKGAEPRAKEPDPELFGEMIGTTTGDPPARFQIEDSKLSTPLVAIYRIEGDTLFLCLRKGEKGHEYPTKFATNPATGDELLVLKKAAAKSDPHLIPEEETILKDVERRIDPANTDGKSLPFALLEHNRVAALRFGKWRVVFEGVPCDARGKVLFGVGSFFLPEAGGRGNFADPGLKRPAPALRQQSTGRGNVVAIERYEFQLESKGTRLKFADRTYEATDVVQTIVIAPDGTTRPEPAK